MLMNMTQKVALFAVPLLIYSYAAFVSFIHLSMSLTKLFSRTLINEADFGYRTSHFSVIEWHTTKYHSKGFCYSGEILRPENTTLYLRSSDGFMSEENFSFVETVSSTFHTVIMDCPDLSKIDFATTDSTETVHARILRQLKSIIAFNSRQNSRERQPIVKVWFRLSEEDNNATMHFKNFHCIANSMAANTIQPGTVQGLVLNGKFLSSLKVDDLKIVTSYWKKIVRRFGLKRLGLLLDHSHTSSGSECAEMKNSPLMANDEILSKYNKIFYYSPGGAWANLNAGISAITSSKYKECKQSLIMNAPNGVKIRITDVLQELDLFVAGRMQKKFCRTYHLDL